MPRGKAFFNYQSGIAEMNLKIFAVWGVWDTILTTILVFVFWLTTKVYGNTNKAIFIAGTTVWIGVFVIFIKKYFSPVQLILNTSVILHR